MRLGRGSKSYPATKAAPKSRSSCLCVVLDYAGSIGVQQAEPVLTAAEVLVSRLRIEIKRLSRVFLHAEAVLVKVSKAALPDRVSLISGFAAHSTALVKFFPQPRPNS